jgi:hypothetical protein
MNRNLRRGSAHADSSARHRRWLRTRVLLSLALVSALFVEGWTGSLVGSVIGDVLAIALGVHLIVVNR